MSLKDLIRNLLGLNKETKKQAEQILLAELKDDKAYWHNKYEAISREFAEFKAENLASNLKKEFKKKDEIK